jgi:hypothetical protein
MKFSNSLVKGEKRTCNESAFVFPHAAVLEVEGIFVFNPGELKT